LANETNNPGIKGKLIDMAELWMKLAEKAERNNEIYRNNPQNPSEVTVQAQKTSP
jgi:hypothetical protein